MRRIFLKNSAVLVCSCVISMLYGISVGRVFERRHSVGEGARRIA